ncbi:MAG: DUF484 family protein [Alistipes senegalensis]|nr:DUF484 family protein [Oxalobacter formigenes]MCM1281369.1 DUF484 family protein [Alistipes senegalensis]
MKQDIDSAAIAAWLQENPEFFNEQAELLSRIRLVSPVIGKTISLHDRQIEIIREKNKGLERRIAELIRIARDNDTLMRHIQKWTRAILKAKGGADRPRILLSELQSIFTIPHATLRLWNLDETYAGEWFTQGISESIRIFAQGLQAPYCGKNNDYEASRWLEEAASIASVALVPLRTENGTFGLLVLGSPDETRFRADMATDFLSEMAQTASAALACLMA